MTSWGMETRAAYLVCWEDSYYSGMTLGTNCVGETWSDTGNVQTPLLGGTPSVIINYSHLVGLCWFLTQSFLTQSLYQSLHTDAY